MLMFMFMPIVPQYCYGEVVASTESVACVNADLDPARRGGVDRGVRSEGVRIEE
jgi:hypothetical protein